MLSRLAVPRDCPLRNECGRAALAECLKPARRVRIAAGPLQGPGGGRGSVARAQKFAALARHQLRCHAYSDDKLFAEEEV